MEGYFIMHKFRVNLKRLLGSSNGTSALEMGLILAMIVIAMMVALQNFANENSRIWGVLRQSTANANSSTTS